MAVGVLARSVQRLASQSSAAAAESVIKIKRVRSRALSRRVKLGLNKAIVVDLPTDAHDILVADPSWPMP
jgi:pilus assembly protein CpaC